MFKNLEFLINPGKITALLNKPNPIKIDPAFIVLEAENVCETHGHDVK